MSPKHTPSSTGNSLLQSSGVSNMNTQDLHSSGIKIDNLTKSNDQPSLHLQTKAVKRKDDLEWQDENDCDDDSDVKSKSQAR